MILISRCNAKRISRRCLTTSCAKRFTVIDVQPSEQKAITLHATIYTVILKYPILRREKKSMGMNKVLLSRHDIVIRKFFPFRNISPYSRVKFKPLNSRKCENLLIKNSLIKEIYNFVNITQRIVHWTRMQMLKV